MHGSSRSASSRKEPHKNKRIQFNEDRYCDREPETYGHFDCEVRGLNSKEYKVLNLLKLGLSQVEISQKFSVDPTYINQICNKIILKSQISELYSEIVNTMGVNLCVRKWVQMLYRRGKINLKVRD